MWGTHLKQKGRSWHYYRAVPKEFSDADRRGLISFTLKTGDYVAARRKAAEVSAQLEDAWRTAKMRGVSLSSQDAAERHGAAQSFQQSLGFAPKSATDISDEDLLERLHILLGRDHAPEAQKAALGLVQEPEFSLADALDRFWDYIKDEWTLLSRDQKRVKRNVYLKAIRNFEQAVGRMSFYKVERSHAIKFRSWSMNRIQEKGLKPYLDGCHFTRWNVLTPSSSEAGQ